MRTYETVFIIDPDLTEEDTEKAIQRIITIIEGQKGKIALLDPWGKRKLAYRVKKKVKGNYIRIIFYGEPKIVAILERNLRIMEDVLKFLTINLAATEIEITVEEKKDEDREPASTTDSRSEAAAPAEESSEKEDIVASRSDSTEETGEPDDAEATESQE